MFRVSTNPVVAKAEAILTQKGQIFHIYGQNFNLHTAFLGCIFFVWVALGVLLKLISPE